MLFNTIQSIIVTNFKFDLYNFKNFLNNLNLSLGITKLFVKICHLWPSVYIIFLERIFKTKLSSFQNFLSYKLLETILRPEETFKVSAPGLPCLDWQY